MSNLGDYQKITTISKVVGGPGGSNGRKAGRCWNKGREKIYIIKARGKKKTEGSF